MSSSAPSSENRPTTSAAPLLQGAEPGVSHPTPWARAGRAVPRARGHLNLRWCELITDAGLAHLAKLTNLRYLNLWNCARLTSAAVEALQGAVPGCRIDR